MKNRIGRKLVEGYRRAARRAYRVLRHPRHRRKSRLHAWLAERVFDRHLWKLEREPVARGLAVGLFLSMIPVPMQMIMGVGTAIWKRLNIPAVVAGCWLTNPATLWLYVFPFQLGCWILGLFGVEVVTEEMSNWEVAAAMLSFDAVQALLLGCLIIGSALAVVGYGAVHLGWAIWGAVAEGAPARGGPAKSEV